MSDEDKLSKYSPSRSIIERNKRNLTKNSPGRPKPPQEKVYQNCLAKN